MVNIDNIRGNKVEFLKLNIAAFEKRIKKIEKEKMKTRKILGNNIMDQFCDDSIDMFKASKQEMEELLKELEDTQAE